MRAARALRPSMLRGILQVIFVFIFLRFLFSILRLLTGGSRPDSSRMPEREGAARRRKAMRVDPSNVTDVPFTEIPAGDATRVEPEQAKRVEAR